MARPIPDLDQMTAAEVATDDSIIIDDTSAGETKRINVGALLGLPVVGWTSSGEVHTFVSWNATTRIGVIGVPSNATTKYQVGNRYRLTQATGGTKYGIIHGVTATQLTVFFPTGTTLNNEAITNPYYSQLDTPIGFNKDPELWTLVYSKNNRTQTAATVNVFYNLFGSLTIGFGKWLVSYANPGIVTSSSAGYLSFNAALGTTTSGGVIAGSRFYSSTVQPANTQQNDQSDVYNIPYNVTTDTTLYGLMRSPSTGSLTLYSEAANSDGMGNMYIKAISAYL